MKKATLIEKRRAQWQLIADRDDQDMPAIEVSIEDARWTVVGTELQALRLYYRFTREGGPCDLVHGHGEKFAIFGDVTDDYEGRIDEVCAGLQEQAQ